MIARLKQEATPKKKMHQAEERAKALNSKLAEAHRKLSEAEAWVLTVAQARVEYKTMKDFYNEVQYGAASYLLSKNEV